jgi:peptidoglycan/xylan/chitin deacetylase (PgdA/CDA1 family)
MTQLRVWAGADATGRPAYRAMSAEELRQLAASPLIEIGAHTRTHPMLSGVSEDEQRAEVIASRDDLISLVGKQPHSFSYPFGRRIDYDAQTQAIVREAGFDCACANFEDVVGAAADPWQVPRIQIQDWSGQVFLDRLRSWT